MANIFDTDVALITDVLRVNLIGPFLAIKHAAPRIAERGGGAIVLTASVAGIRSGAGSPAYSASKAGVIKPRRGRRAAIVGQQRAGQRALPGLTETGMTKPVFDYAREADKLDRVGRPQPPAPRRAAGRAGQGRAVPRLRRCELCQRTGDRGSTAACRRATPVTRQDYGKTAV
ncbi:MAG: SDR family NAD(P)-dependent oxidoreductase [Sphingomonas taxi]